MIPGPHDAELSDLDLCREGVPGTGAGFVPLPVLTVTHTFRAERSSPLGPPRGFLLNQQSLCLTPLCVTCTGAKRCWSLQPMTGPSVLPCVQGTHDAPPPFRPVLLLRDGALSAAGARLL